MTQQVYASQSDRTFIASITEPALFGSELDCPLVNTMVKRSTRFGKYGEVAAFVVYAEAHLPEG